VPASNAQNILALRPSAKAGQADLIIYGDIGESWWGESVTAKDVVKQLAELDPSTEQINVRINSYGGSVADGLAIYNALRAHPARKVSTIDGVAMSIASLILMAGDEVQAPETSLLMIHAPWGGIIGNAEEMRRYADILDTYAASMVSAYVRKSGQDADDIRALLTDGKDHYYTGAEAIAEGFADALEQADDAGATTADANAYDPGALVRGLLQRHLSGAPSQITAMAMTACHRMALPSRAAAPPAALTPSAAPAAADQPESPASTTEETTMPNEHTPGVTTGAQDPSNAPADRAAILAAERQRRSDIRALFARFPGREGLDAVQQQCEDDPECSADAAGKRLLETLAKSTEPLNPRGRVEHVADHDRATFRAGAVAATLHRADPSANQMTEQAREFRGMNLRDLARAACERAGVRTAGMTPSEIAVKALHSTSDFPYLLESIVTKSLRAGYDGTQRTFVPFCRRATLPDFKTVSRVQLAGAPSLKKVLEGAEYEQGTIGEGAEKYQLSKYGRIVSATWETVINDDLDGLTRLPTMFGRSAADLESDVVYAIITANAALADGVALFHADHTNLGTAGVISDTTLSEAREKMLLQKGIEGRYITVRPEFLIVPPKQLTKAQQFTSLPIQPNAASSANPFYNALTIVVEPRLQDSSATAWYVSANPAAVDTIEYAYLEGAEGVFTETKQGFEVDGVQVKCRHVFAAKAIDYRGLFKNAGA
jgi:ATP-dependent protease ClpP protease subunit